MQYFFSFVNHGVGRKPFPGGLRCLLPLQLLLLLLIISPSSLDLLLSQPIGGGTGADTGDENTARVLRAGIATAAAAAAEEEEEDSSLSILLDRYPAHSAAQLNKSDIIRILCRYGADLNKLDNHGEAPVHVAAYNNYPDVIRALHACGADLNKRNTNGETPAHVAARTATDHSSVLQALYECGTDLNRLDSTGHTPAEVAAAMHDPTALSLIAFVSVLVCILLVKLRCSLLYRTLSELIVSRLAPGEFQLKYGHDGLVELKLEEIGDHPPPISVRCRALFCYLVYAFWGPAWRDVPVLSYLPFKWKDFITDCMNVWEMEIFLFPIKVTTRRAGPCPQCGASVCFKIPSGDLVKGVCAECFLEAWMSQDDRSVPQLPDVIIEALTLAGTTTPPPDALKEQDKCPSCHDEYFDISGQDVLMLPCGHLMCKKCSLEWFFDHDTCPVCCHDLFDGQATNLMSQPAAGPPVPPPQQQQQQLALGPRPAFEDDDNEDDGNAPSPVARGGSPAGSPPTARHFRASAPRAGQGLQTSTGSKSLSRRPPHHEADNNNNNKDCLERKKSKATAPTASDQSTTTKKKKNKKKGKGVGEKRSHPRSQMTNMPATPQENGFPSEEDVASAPSLTTTEGDEPEKKGQRHE